MLKESLNRYVTLTLIGLKTQQNNDIWYSRVLTGLGRKSGIFISVILGNKKYEISYPIAKAEKYKHNYSMKTSITIMCIFLDFCVISHLITKITVDFMKEKLPAP